jgi:hypothetical protein
MPDKTAVPISVIGTHTTAIDKMRSRRANRSPPTLRCSKLVADYERRILNRLEQSHWSQTDAAASLRVPLSTLNQKIKRLEIDIKRKSIWWHRLFIVDRDPNPCNKNCRVLYCGLCFHRRAIPSSFRYECALKVLAQITSQNVPIC